MFLYNCIDALKFTIDSRIYKRSNFELFKVMKYLHPKPNLAIAFEYHF